jgi:hypothetical protein
MQTPRDRAREASRQARLQDTKRELANLMDDNNRRGDSGEQVTGRTLTPDVARKNKDLLPHARKAAIAKRKTDRESTGKYPLGLYHGITLKGENKRPLKDI